MNHPEFRLVKDFFDGVFVFYWFNPVTKQRASVYCHTQDEAGEWWLTYHFNQYDGIERRKSIIDRRSLHGKRDARSRGHNFVTEAPDGRRRTDVPIKVDRDVSARRLKDYIVQMGGL